MRFTRNKLVIGTATTALVLSGAGAALAAGGGDDDGEGKATGRGADRARAAALAIVEGGTANSVERDSENAATWEVEVTKTTGKTVDVRLDAAYKLVIIEDDSEVNDAQDDAGDE